MQSGCAPREIGPRDILFFYDCNKKGNIKNGWKEEKKMNCCKLVITKNEKVEGKK